MSDAAYWRRKRANVALETNLARKGFVRLGDGSPDIDGEDLLGPVKASVALRLVDLEVIAWLSARRVWRRADVAFCASHIATDLFGRAPGGRERRIVAASLERLGETSLTFRGYDAASDSIRSFEQVGLIESLERIDGRTSRVRLASWFVRQLELDYVTYLHWPTLRSLRDLAKRLWIYLEAEDHSRKRRDGGPPWLALSDRGFASLGMRYAKEPQARAAIARAARRIETVDPAYRLAIRMKGPGYRLESRVINEDDPIGLIDHPEWAWQGGAETAEDADESEFAEPDEGQGDIDWPDPQGATGAEGGDPDDGFDRYGPGDAERIVELATSDWPWPGQTPGALLTIWDSADSATYHEADCPSILGLAEDLDRVSQVALAPRAADLAAWLVHNRIASPRACRFCAPPRLPFWSAVPDVPPR